MGLNICFLGLENLPVLTSEFNRYAVGGEQVQHTLLARALARRGHCISMVVHDYGQADRSRWHAVTTYKACRANAGLPVLRFIHPRWTSVWSALKRADAHIYYASCAGMHLGLLALFCRRYGRKLVFRVAHDTDCLPDQLLIAYWRDKKLYEYGLRRSDGILVQSALQQQALATHYGLPSQIAGMLVDAPAPAAAVAPRSVDVLWVNNLRDFKRPDLLLALARALPQFQFHLVGGPQPGFEALYTQIRSAAQQLPNVRFHGAVPYHAMGRHFAAARLLVNTSASEGYPNAYLQAWIRGTPVVAFFDPGQVIAAHGLGRSVATLPDMAGAVAQLLNEPAAWHEASARSRAYMARHFGEQQVLDTYLALFSEIT